MDFLKLAKKLLFLPLWLIFVLTLISTAALVIVFVKGWENTLVAYPVYVLSFYSLSVVCLASWKTVPAYYKSVKGKVYENKYANRYLTDATFKTHVSLYISLGVNLLYVVINALSSVIYSTSWFAIFAFYYAIMAIMRFLLLRYVNRNGLRNNRLGELRRARLCSYILMIVNVILSGVVLMMVYNNRGFDYQGILIYVMAMYTFWVTTTAIIGLVRYRKYNSPIMSASKMIKLAAAMVSMLSLETAMFAQFGADTSIRLQQSMIMATGGVIAAVVVSMSVYMIVRSTKEIKNLTGKECKTNE